MRKFIFVTGGVVSGLGKGIAAASIGHILSSQYTVVPIKCDGYLNTDPGTMNPVEHGEVFVLDDGSEVDMDFGHYERFLGTRCFEKQSLTMGKVFSQIQEKERRGDYLGKTVQFIPHVTDHIQHSFETVGKEKNADIVIIEIGGTVGDIENELYIEAARQFALKQKPEDCMFVHLTYVPYLDNVKEQKTKPTQMSVRQLLERGIRPDILIARGPHEIEQSMKEKIALFANMPARNIISGHDVDLIYKIPQVYLDQHIADLLSEKLNITLDMKEDPWKPLLHSYANPTKKITIGICGKYTALEDSYASILEALKHCRAHLNVEITVKIIETTHVTKQTIDSVMKNIEGVIIPGGFGNRGTEGKIEIIRYCREKNIPFLGICLGLQLAVIEFARNICGIVSATSEEFDAKATEQLIVYLEGQRENKKLGGTLRLGLCEAQLEKTFGERIYGSIVAYERHRHRYEVNPEHHGILRKNGLQLSGMSPNGELVEFISLPEQVHPYFVATQGHPELLSLLEKPAPLFFKLIEACLKK